LHSPHDKREGPEELQGLGREPCATLPVVQRQGKKGLLMHRV